jgi:hypothetical protein
MSSDDPHRYYLEMQFDANFDCVISIYICARECRNATNTPLYFYTDPEMQKPEAFKFGPGLKQKFPPKLFVLDTSIYCQGPDGT